MEGDFVVGFVAFVLPFYRSLVSIERYPVTLYEPDENVDRYTSGP